MECRSGTWSGEFEFFLCEVLDAIFRNIKIPISAASGSHKVRIILLPNTSCLYVAFPWPYRAMSFSVWRILPIKSVFCCTFGFIISSSGMDSDISFFNAQMVIFQSLVRWKHRRYLSVERNGSLHSHICSVLKIRRDVLVPLVVGSVGGCTKFPQFLVGSPPWCISCWVL